MPGYEKAPINPEKKISPDEQERLSHEGHERLREQHESNVERTPEKNTPENAKHEVEKAYEKSNDKDASNQEVNKSKEKEQKQQPIGRSAKEANFRRVMKEVQPQLNPASRAFSKFIHNRAVEKTSETVGKTIARPNAILSGAVFAFFLSLAVYLIGRYLGYPLSGFESIGAFILGWVVGILYDFFKVMITGKKA